MRNQYRVDRSHLGIWLPQPNSILNIICIFRPTNANSFKFQYEYRFEWWKTLYMPFNNMYSVCSTDMYVEHFGFRAIIHLNVLVTTTNSNCMQMHLQYI